MGRLGVLLEEVVEAPTHSQFESRDSPSEQVRAHAKPSVKVLLMQPLTSALKLSRTERLQSAGSSLPGQ